MYLEPRMVGFYDELEKISHELTQGERTDFAQPKKEEEGHKGKYPIPDKKHYGIALGFAKMHHDPGALAAIHAKGKKMGYTKEAEGFGSPNITDADEMAKMGGFLKNTMVGLGMLGATAGGAKAIKSVTRPVAHLGQTIAKPMGAASSQAALLAREGVKLASRRSS